VLAVDDRHVAFSEYNGSVARIICVAVATLANEKLLERASDNDLLLGRTDFPKLAEKLSVIRTDRHENLVSPKNILPVRKNSL
jgi:hypothetical protein